MKSLLRSKPFITLITALVCATAVIAALPREPNLLDAATPTKIPIRDFPAACGNCDWVESRTWLNETEVAIAQAETFAFAGLKPLDARLTIWNSRTNAHYIQSHYPRASRYTENYPAISPDGTRVLWKDKKDTHIVDLATGRPLDWPGRTGSINLGNCWFADGKRWLQWDTMPDYVTVYDAAQPGPGTRYSFQRHGAADIADRYLNPCLASNDHIIVAKLEKSSATFLEFMLQPQQRRLALLCARNAAPPTGYDICNCQVSPAGDRAAWLLVHTGQDPAMGFLRRLLNLTTTQSGVTESIWTSTLDGQDWREVGSLNSSPKEPATPFDILEIEWLPGGKRLTFNYNNTIYTVPAAR